MGSMPVGATASGGAVPSPVGISRSMRSSWSRTQAWSAASDARAGPRSRRGGGAV